MVIDDVSQWIKCHDILVVSVIMPILSTFIAAGAAWYSTRKALKVEKYKTKIDSTLKISEFRQEWINTLREAMAEFQSYGILPDRDPTRERAFYKLGTKIELLMNPDDPDFKKLQILMYNFMQVSNGKTIDKYAQNPAYIELCQRILKREWERLKSDLNDAMSV